MGGFLSGVAGHDRERASFAASFVISGACAALVFRAGLHFLAAFFLPEESERDG